MSACEEQEKDYTVARRAVGRLSLKRRFEVVVVRFTKEFKAPTHALLPTTLERLVSSLSRILRLAPGS